MRTDSWKTENDPGNQEAEMGFVLSLSLTTLYKVFAIYFSFKGGIENKSRCEGIGLNFLHPPQLQKQKF